MTLPLIVAVTAALLVVVSLIQPLAARLGVPASVLLAFVGVGLGSAALLALNAEMPGAFAQAAHAIQDFPIDSQAFLYVFLPTLLFHASLTLDVRRMAEDSGPILVLAVLAVLASTAAVGLSLAFASDASLIVCLLLGAIVATTDPIAVVSVFRDIGAPGRLGRLVEGESLLNDAAAITLFTTFLGLLAVDGSTDFGHVALEFLKTLLGGALVGYLAGRVTAVLLGLVREDRFAQASLSFALPYLAYVGAEQGLHVSGVIAAVAAGLTLNVLGPARASPEGWRYLRDVWEQMAFWAGSLVFLLASAIIPELLQDVGTQDLLLLLILIAATLAARAFVLFAVLPALTTLRLSQAVNAPFKIVILWGGLRGAVTLALALAVTENAALDAETKRFVAVLATGFVLFTLMVQGTTMGPLIGVLGLNRLSPRDRSLRNQVLAVALENVREAVEKTAATYRLPPPLAWEVARVYAERVDKAVADSDGEISDRDRIRLGLVSLAERERELILQHFHERTVSVGIVAELLTNAARMLDRARAGGRLEYMRASKRTLEFSWRFAVAQRLHRRFGLTRGLEKLLANRFERLMVSRLILDLLPDFVRAKIAPVLGGRVGEILEEILSLRRETLVGALEALRLQYPDYATALERRFLKKSALRREEGEYGVLYEDGLIGSALLRHLRRSIKAERDLADLRPKLDLKLQTHDLVRRLPLFSGLSDQEIEDVSRLLQPAFATPGTTLIKQGERGDSVYFISSGAVEVHAPGGKVRLGRGDFFGELALLTRRRRQTDVTAIGYCSLLILYARDFQVFLADHPEVKMLMSRVAAERLQMNEDARQETQPA